MIAIDTNVLIRLLTQDDQVQYERAVQLFSHGRLFLPDTVLLECERVLRYVYEFEASQISGALRKVVSLPNVMVRDLNSLVLALDWHAQGLDFADAFNLALSMSCSELATFDRQFSRRASSFAPVPVRLIE